MEPIARNLGTAAPLANRRDQRSDPVQFFFQDRTTVLMSRLADQPCDWGSLNGSTANPFRFTANLQQGIDSPETNFALRSLIEVHYWRKLFARHRKSFPKYYQREMKKLWRGLPCVFFHQARRTAEIWMPWFVSTPSGNNTLPLFFWETGQNWN
jgi:hypothetical protein